MRWTVHVAPVGVRRNVFRILIGKLKGKGPISWEIVHRLKGDMKCISNITAENYKMNSDGLESSKNS
jgi:hypothetical protein